MKVKVTNKRPVSVSAEGRSFRPRSVTEIEADERTIRRISARYGLSVEAVVPDVPRGMSIAIEDDPALICPTCGKVCGSAIGLGSHIRAKHKES